MPPRILITGFGPFPGAPYNPTPDLVARLVALRRPALAGVIRIGHIFTVTYGTVDDELPKLIATHRPDALLMFGLAQSTPFIRVETRARNAVSLLWPDAGHTAVRRMTITPDGEALQFGPHTRTMLRAAQATGIDCRASRDAGRYLCNYLSFRALQTTRQPDGPRLATFVHVPTVPRRGGRPQRGQLSAEDLVTAGTAVLLETARLTHTRPIR